MMWNDSKIYDTLCFSGQSLVHKRLEKDVVQRFLVPPASQVNHLSF